MFAGIALKAMVFAQILNDFVAIAQIMQLIFVYTHEIGM